MGTREVTVQLLDSAIRRVVQAVEPEAAHLLTEHGGKIARYELHGMYYWDYEPWEDQCVLSFTPGTLAVYVSANGQEDTSVVFAVFLLPALRARVAHGVRLPSQYTCRSYRGVFHTSNRARERVCPSRFASHAPRRGRLIRERTMPLAEFQQATLQECMQQPGCPLCRAVWKMDAARFGWDVNDQIADSIKKCYPIVKG